ncbi:MAG: hypothetical protein WCF40_08965 [Desulfobacterales bacterium]
MKTMGLKRLIVIAGAVLLLQSPLWAAELTEGFSGINWGAPIETLRHFKEVGSHGEISYYLNPDVLHTIGGVEVPHVIYGFYAKRLFAVYAQIDSLEVYARIKNDLQSHYGIPKVAYGATGEPEVYRWKSGQIKIKLKTDNSLRKIKVAVYYTPLSDKVNEAGEEKYRESEFKFLPIERGKEPLRLPLLDF